VLNVTHLGRGPTVAQQMALLWTSPGCAIDACDRVARIEIDHRDPYAKVGCTQTANLRPRCDHHHDLKTYHGWDDVELPDGRIIMVPPGDPRHPGHQPGGP
jgi:hypothetical protein